MGSFRSVLCATDLSDGADTALRAADREARLHGARLAVVHALVGPDLGAPMSPAAVERSMIGRERLASELIDVLLTQVAQSTGRSAEEVSVAVEAGAPAEVIARHAAELGADLVVVGATGATGVRRWLGGVAAQVVRAVPAPVLVARAAEGAGVLLATDLCPRV